MKNMMMFALGLLLAVGAVAQGPNGKMRKGGGSPEKRAEKITGWMKKTVNLSADQEVKVKQINLDAARSLQLLRNDTTLEKEARHAKRKAIAENTKTQLKAAMTAEQWTLLEQKLKEKRAEKKSRMKGKKEKMGGGVGKDISDDELDAIID
jgi:predicted RNA-binding protein with RPS1 domain